MMAMLRRRHKKRRDEFEDEQAMIQRIGEFAGGFDVLVDAIDRARLVVGKPLGMPVDMNSVAREVVKQIHKRNLRYRAKLR